MHPQLSKCGNAGRIAKWILENIGDPLDHWQHGNGVTSAGSGVTLAIGDTVVTLQNKWWGVRGSLTRGYTTDQLLRIWDIRHVWAPPWLREGFSLSRGIDIARWTINGGYTSSWGESHASENLRRKLRMV